MQLYKLMCVNVYEYSSVLPLSTARASFFLILFFL